MYYTDLFNWHFLVKKSRDLDKSFFTPFDEYHISKETKKQFHISNDMLDKKQNLEYLQNFKIK